MNIQKILFLALICLISLAGCERTDFDELLRRQGNLQEQIDGHAARLKALETAVTGINSDIVALQKIMQALQQKVSIVSYQSTNTGYLLTMSDGSSIRLENGKDGSNGKDGANGKDGKDGINAPVIGVKQDADGVYYWTLGGEFIVNNGNKIPVTGRDGTDGKDGAPGTTPQLRVDADKNQWLVSYDGGKSWVIILDGAGKPVPATGAPGPQGPVGPEGNSFGFSIVEEGDGLIKISYKGQTYTLRRTEATIASGEQHTFFLVGERLYASGFNSRGQFGIGNTNGTNSPVYIMSGVKSVVVGGTIHSYSVVLKTDGSVWVAGSNRDGQLGIGDLEQRQVETFTKITDNVKAIFAGKALFVIKNDGGLWAAGKNEFGQFGLGDTEARSSLTYITDNVVSVSETFSHCLVLKADGTLYGAGANNRHQLGLTHEQTPKVGPGNTFYTDELIQCNTNVRAISVGNNGTSFLLKRDGSVWGTGYNQYGELGTGDRTTRNTWTQLAEDVKDIAAGYNFSMLLKNNGSVWVSGGNEYGQLGTGSYSSVSNFTQVATDVEQIFTGHSTLRSWIKKKDSNFFVTGFNANGEFGIGNNQSVNSFVKVSMP